MRSLWGNILLIKGLEQIIKDGFDAGLREIVRDEHSTDYGLDNVRERLSGPMVQRGVSKVLMHHEYHTPSVRQDPSNIA